VCDYNLVNDLNDTLLASNGGWITFINTAPAIPVTHPIDMRSQQVNYCGKPDPKQYANYCSSAVVVC
jgi:hypothetical protein